jgi:hypothetical protein
LRLLRPPLRNRAPTAPRASPRAQASVGDRSVFLGVNSGRIGAPHTSLDSRHTPSPRCAGAWMQATT